MPLQPDPPRSRARPEPDLVQVMDALVLFDTPLLDQRFQEAIAMHPRADVRAELAALPERVAEGARLTRHAAVEWERIVGNGVLEQDFKEHAERFLLEAYLEAAEAQIRLKTFMARQAPTREVRALIDQAIDVHRRLVEVLRKALGTVEEPAARTQAPVAPLVGWEEQHGDIRSQVERAIRHLSATDKKPRELILSANALRHLRDQGLFQDRETSVLGVPVQVDFSWPDATFALTSFDSAPLDEIVHGG